MASFDLSLMNGSNKQSILERNVLIPSKSSWKSSSETTKSPTNSNGMLSCSAEDAKSETEFDEHPYSISNRMKTSNLNSRNKPKSKYSTRPNQCIKTLSEDNEDLSCWPTSSVELEINRLSSKTRQRRSKCETKNAVMARLNRLKKKKYVTDLEGRNAKLEAENEKLRKGLAKRLKEVLSLKRETVNLHSVIKNSTEIGSLLQCVQKNTNLHITSSFLRNGSHSELNKNLPLIHSKSSRSSIAPRAANDEDINKDEGRIHELNLFQCGKQSILTKTNSLGLSSEHSLINDICDLDSEINPSDSDLLCGFKGEVDSNGFFNSNILSNTEFTVTDANELVRCETPSKDIDISFSNNDFSFDDVGVCFHIANKKVSLEFCESCNHKAAILSDCLLA